MSSLFYQLLLAISRRNWFYITLTVNYLANTPHHSLLLSNFSLIPPHSQFQHLSSKARPHASCSEQQGYTNINYHSKIIQCISLLSTALLLGNKPSCWQQGENNFILTHQNKTQFQLQYHLWDRCPNFTQL